MSDSHEGFGWSEVADAAPDLTDAVERCFAARRMKCLATVRRNGWPRLSETSGVLIEAGRLWLMMIPSAKANDIGHDARAAVHCGSPTDEWAPSARVTGWARAADREDFDRLHRVRPALAARDGSSLQIFTMTVTEVVVTGPDPNDGDIAIEWWTPGTGLRRSTRPGG
jgi:hypothetical protein